MKKLNNLFLVFFILLAACQNDDLPKASFNLNAIKEFSGEAVHEKVNLVWETPNGDTTPESIILKWSPEGETISLDPLITNYEVDGLKNGTIYEFIIQADYGDQGRSGENTIQLLPQDQLMFKVLPGNELGYAVWETPSREDILSYTLSWSPEGDTMEIPFDANTYQITDLTNNIEYNFSFVINYSNGNISKENQATMIPGDISAFLLNEESPMAGNLIEFTYNPSFLPLSSAVSWSYDFGDGNISTEANPNHVYTTPGIYDINIQITDNQGITFNDTKQVFVWGEKWAFDTGFQIRPQSPVIADDGTIYIGSEDNNGFYAINPDGSLKWIYNHITDNVYASASIGSDGTIYVGAKDNKLHAINPDGTQKWTFNIGGDAIYTTPAIAEDGTIYIGSDDNNVYAVNPDDGTEKWVFSTGGNVRSTAAIANDGTVYITSDDDNLYALAPVSGTLKWSFPVAGNAQSGIAIDSDGTLIVVVDQGGSTGAIFAINPNGTEKWSKTVLGRISVCAPAIANGTIYVGTKEGNNLLALDASSGMEIWSFNTPGAIINSSPAVDKNGIIYFGSWDNHVYAVNPDGTLKYKFLTGGEIWSSPAIGHDGTIYIGSYDNKLYALEMFAEGLANNTPWPMFGKDIKHSSRQ